MWKWKQWKWKGVFFTDFNISWSARDGKKFPPVVAVAAPISLESMKTE